MAALAPCDGRGAHAVLTAGLAAGALLLSLAAPVQAQDDSLPLMQGPGEPVGTRHEIRFEDLPEPYATPSASNRPVVIDRPAGAMLRVPEGFKAALYAEGLNHPRFMALAPDGAVFVTEPHLGEVLRLEDKDGDGKAETRSVYADAFERPSGIAFRDGQLFVADLRAVWQLGYAKGLEENQARRPVTRAGALGQGGGHWTRDIAFGPDGALYVAVGSEGNIEEEEAPRATIQRFDPGAFNRQETFAAGLRNASAIAFHPQTDKLFAAVNERDGYGDELVPDYLTEVRARAFYGWPYAYLGPNPDPEFGQIRPDLVKRTRAPDLLIAAHSAPTGLLFYQGAQFPERYRQGAFISLRGSWNRERPTGYKVVFAPFKNGKPEGHYLTFAAGFWRQGEQQAEVIGRPVGLTETKDGALLIADDAGGAIWRVTYEAR